ncbi:SMC5-like protein [Cercophora newfieldiana]|uniref:Structural maintenance of chromosomes protein 5 n=1 Tax=Cercophora newfieldiana TaxID=92897 RepID=A0AA39YRC8_9PEZI|nr:SMC5-like protein [Cercophora newfieldiana]
MVERNHHESMPPGRKGGPSDSGSLSTEDDGIFNNLSLRGGDGSQDTDSVKDEPSDNDLPPSRQRRGAQRRAAPRPVYGASKDVFQPGAIVRVKLQNFVTYEKAEFSLGPNLNMVIGPNGTGKSSLVCAICLGLGYPSSVLGRASAFGDFVKHGKDEAEIEVELQGRAQDRENFIVGLCITRENNSRRFTLNGLSATVKEVQKLMRSLRIQIDNLCQFLPQDKVAEFAGLTPVDLLEKTLHAAASPEMIEWQKELKENFVAHKETQRKVEQSTEHLRKLEARQQVLQADVEKIQERKLIQETIEKLEAIHLLCQYDEARKAYSAAKKRTREAEAEQQRLKESSEPSLRAANDKHQYAAAIQTVIKEREAALRAAETAADRALATVDGIESKAQELGAEYDAERTGLQSKKQDLSKIRRRITGHEAELKQRPKDFDAAEWNRKIREQEHLEREKGNEIADLEQELQSIASLGREKKREMEQLQQSVGDLDSKEGQRFNQVAKFFPDVAAACKLLKENQDIFEKPVFGPAALTCSVKSPEYSDVVQSILGQKDLLCFTAQTNSDHKKLSALFFDKTDEKPRSLQVDVRTSVKPLDFYRPPVPRDQLQQIGLEGYVLDYLEGPEPVLAMLCYSKIIHASALSLNDLPDSQFSSVIDDGRISQFACGKRSCRVTRRREYGPGAVTTSINQVRQGRWWTDQPPDMNEKEELVRKHKAIEDEVEEMKGNHRQQKQKLEALLTEKADIVENIGLLRKQKNELQVEYAKHQSLPDKIANEKRAAQQKDQELQSIKRRLIEIQQKQGQVILDKAKAVLIHQKKMGDIRSAYHALLTAQLLLVEAKSDLAFLNDRNSEIAQRLKDGADTLKASTAELEAKKREAKAFWQQVLSFSEEFRQGLVDEAKNRSAESVQQEINAERAKLEVVQANNPQALEEHERWAQLIEKGVADHETHERRLAELVDKIATRRSQWEPRVDALVEAINEAFSYNFEQISCAGEVGVHKDEDFDKWSIEIKVKFRQGETLQRLDQHRQSGGERAVSTIFYLMSLQSMAQAPFRVVDEINQGMDPRNERMVHERMVEIACREHTSQYFLITPKLLSGLRYDERMRVHTIVSGEHVDVNGTEKMNFAQFANLQRRTMAH